MNESEQVYFSKLQVDKKFGIRETVERYKLYKKIADNIGIDEKADTNIPECIS